MAKINERTNPLVEAYHKICELSVFGDNAVLRRALNILGEAIQNDGKGLEIASIPSCGPQGGRDRDPQCTNFSISDAVYEFQQDDRRRSVFLDLEEAVLANLVDFYSGRLNVLEFRYLDDGKNLEELEQKAIEYMKGREPIVKVNHLLASSDQEVVEMLRALADNLEKGIHQQNAEILIKENTEEALLKAEYCWVHETKVIGSRIINTNELQYLYEETLGCVLNDHCCKNKPYYKKGRQWWQTVRVGTVCKVPYCGCSAFRAAGGSQDSCIGKNSAGGSCGHQILHHSV